MRKIVWFILSMTLFPLMGQADQIAYMDKKTADKAVALIQSKSEVRLYCQPCGDITWSAQPLTAIQAVNTGYDNLWEVAINAANVDLAYVYVDVAGKWQNVAMLLGLKVRNVSKTLPTSNSYDASKNVR